MKLHATGIYYQDLNESIRRSDDHEIVIDGLCGQRYIACGAKNRRFTLYGTPGNGLAQYMDGASVEVFGNCQEAVGDTMHTGEVIVVVHDDVLVNQLGQHGCLGETVACGDVSVGIALISVACLIVFRRNHGLAGSPEIAF